MILENKNLKNIDLIEIKIACSEGFKLKVDQEIELSLFVKNKSLHVMRNIIVNIEEPYMFAMVEQRILKIKRIEPNEEAEMKLSFYALTGGRDFLKFKIRVTELFDLNLQTFETIFFVEGEGLYRGDNHSHSIRSDGQNNNTVLDNVERVKARALAWLTPTDHCHINTEDCDEINNLDDDFICLSNCAEYGQIGRVYEKGEYPNGKSGEHALQYNVTQVNNRLVDGRKWQDVIDQVNAQNGAFYIAHPLYPTIWWNYEEAFNANNLSGIEVWQGDYHALDLPNRRAFDLWDQMNSIGKKLNGLANSDGHFLHRLGHPFIMANLPDLTSENIIEVLKTGHYYGSNGVHIRFMINHAENNQIAYVPRGEKAQFKIYIYDESHILNIKILKNKISSTASLPTIFKEYNFDEDINEFIDEFSFEVAEDEFYRLEVITKCGTIGPGAFLGDYYGLGFGFTNPIYIKEGKYSLKEKIDNVKYTKAGYMYYIKDGQIKTIE